jgi:hypothetical protein
MSEIKINVEHELKKMTDALNGIASKKWPSILADAATETAFHVRNKLRKDMPQYIDRPKPYTLNSMFAEKATPSRLEATVKWRGEGRPSSGGQYLKPGVLGGGRPQKRFEKRLQASGLMPTGYLAIPSDDVQKDAFGNVPANYLLRVLKSIGLIENDSKGGGRKVKGTSQKNFRVFALTQRRGALIPGIYEKVLFFGSSAVRRLFTFVPKASYKRTFPFYDLGNKYAQEVFSKHLNTAVQKSINDSSNSTQV